MSVYSKQAQVAYDEAVKTIPALLSAKERGHAGDAAVLLEGYMEVAQQQGLTHQEAWSVLFNASVHWAHQLTKVVAVRDGKRTPLEVIQGMSVVAMRWNP